jgi:hypothetical protein
LLQEGADDRDRAASLGVDAIPRRSTAPLGHPSGYMSQPIRDVDTIDIVGVRNDAGIDLVVVCSGPLDDSSETLMSLREKVRGYIKEACSEDIWNAYPSAVAVQLESISRASIVFQRQR